MSLESKPYYWVRCDNCHADIEYGEFSAYGDAGEALDGSADQDWTTDGEKHHCPSCPDLTRCDHCGKPASPDYDDLCQECWDKAVAEDIDAAEAGAP